MLFGDRAKSILLLCAIGFATLLMAQQAAIFFGLLRWTTAMMRNSKATIWVVDKNTQQLNELQNIRDIEVGRVRSVEGVHWAMPMSFTIIQAKMPDGFFRNIQLIGLDSATLAGHPSQIKKGSIFELLNAKTVMIDQVAIEMLSPDPQHPLDIGSSFEINDKEARVVAICQTDRAFFGYPYVYTTYNQATKYIPPRRRVLSYILAQPAPGQSPREVANRIERETGLNAYLGREFARKTIIWFFKNTGIPIAFGTTVILGFIVGIAIAGQTFYSFILENIPNFAVLKAMGATNRTLYQMMITQASIVGIMGYGFGMGIAGLFGRAVMKNGQPPFFLDETILFTTFFAVFLICYFSVLIAGRKIKEIEPAQVFRV
jgi:putative ABC transport system permease protein